MGVIRRTAAGRRDFESIWDYVAARNISAADELLRTFDSKLRLLSDFPKAGQARPELRPRLRTFPAGGYLLCYRPIRNGIELVRVVHGAVIFGGCFAEPDSASCRLHGVVTVADPLSAFRTLPFARPQVISAVYAQPLSPAFSPAEDQPELPQFIKQRQGCDRRKNQEVRELDLPADHQRPIGRRCRCVGKAEGNGPIVTVLVRDRPIGRNTRDHDRSFQKPNVICRALAMNRPEQDWPHVLPARSRPPAKSRAGPADDAGCLEIARPP
jgi:toxin ParE1/3/4